MSLYCQVIFYIFDKIFNIIFTLNILFQFINLTFINKLEKNPNFFQMFLFFYDVLIFFKCSYIVNSYFTFFDKIFNVFYILKILFQFINLTFINKLE